jgi:mono/diheme cytochrome c family protein
MRHASAAIALSALLVGGCDRKVGDAAMADPGPVPAELADGERLFADNCARCHGALARGTEVGPPLVHVIYEPSHHADFAFQRAAQAGVVAHHWRFGDMPPVPGVTSADVERITAYVRWLQRKAGIG